MLLFSLFFFDTLFLIRMLGARADVQVHTPVASFLIEVSSLGILISTSTVFTTHDRITNQRPTLLAYPKIMMVSIGIGLPPVLRYARRQGLCYDHRQEDILQLLAVEHLIDTSPDLRELPDFVPPQFDPPSDGKLRVSQKASRLVVETTTQPPKPDWRNLLSDHRRIRKLKIEPPLLITDHSKDMRKFLPKRSVGIEDIDFPLEVVDTEKGEGLSWPSHMSTLRSQWDHEITHHKLQTSRETLKFLSRTLRDTWTEEDNRKLVRECSKVEKACVSVFINLVELTH